MDIEDVVGPDPDQVLALVSVADLKRNMRISHSNEDAFVEECIREAYDWFDGLEGWLNRSILTQTWRLTLPGFKKRRYAVTRDKRPTFDWVPTNVIELPLPPLQSVTSIRYLSSGSYETVDPSTYSVQTSGLLGKVLLKDAAKWPTAVDTDEQAVEIVFVAGYGTAADVKSRARGIVKGIKLMASDFFRNREDTYAEPRLVAVNRKIVNGVDRVAGRYKIRNDYV